MNLDIAKEEVARAKHEQTYDHLKASAKNHGLPCDFVLAIASRETNLRNELGDYHDGAFHAVGVMQIDIQHEIAQEAMIEQTWKDHPGPLIEFGCQMLASNRAAIQSRFPDLNPLEVLHFTAASYNAGMGGAERGHREGDCDKYTTGGNYGADVLGRMLVFKEALAEGPRPKRKVPTK